MKISQEILDELAMISPLLAGIERKNAFSVPEGYFDTLTVNTLKNLPASPENQLTVPEGYFDKLSSSILNEIKSLEIDASKELRSLSPMLYSIQNENVFEVPKNYFNSLSDDILQKVTEEPKAKVIQIKRRDPVWRMAVAAIITGIIAVSSLMIFNKSQQTGNEAPVSAYKEASQFKNEKQIDAGIASLSDDEIIKYLEKTGNDADNEVLTKNINDKALPDQQDYLLDEKTLDSYLKNIEKNSNN